VPTQSPLKQTTLRLLRLSPGAHEHEDIDFSNCHTHGNGICGPLVHTGDDLIDANGWVFTWTEQADPIITACVAAAPCNTMPCTTDYICQSRTENMKEGTSNE
jgi:hypothetical protein